MCVHLDADAATITRGFGLMAAMHVTWVRMDIDWSTIENDRGEFNWSYPDKIVNEALARQMNVVAVLAFTPSWARSSGATSHVPPEHSSDYASFARIAAARYAPRGVHTWEIWNEPNSSDFWQPRPDANAYGDLFRPAAEAIRGVDPHATLLTGGLTRGTDMEGARISQTTYLDQLYSNGTAQLADGIAVHPYSFPSLPMDANQAVVGGLNDLPALHALMDRHGDGGKKIWITEFGAPTGTGSEAVSEEGQAAAVAQAGQQVQLWGWAGPLIYYELLDGGDDRTDIEQNFGILRRDLTPKPAGVELMG
jgi:GH35 family endo-1,4-beta-xylanase